MPLGGPEKDVVIRLRVERWIKIDEVYALIANVIAEDLEIVAEIESVFRHVAFIQNLTKLLAATVFSRSCGRKCL